MNTTMAPLEQIQHGSLGQSRRRHDSLRSALRRRDGGSEQKSKTERDGNGGGGDDGRPDDDEKDDDSNKNNGDDGGKKNKNTAQSFPTPSPQLPPAQVAPLPLPLPPPPPPPAALDSPSPSPSPSPFPSPSTTSLLPAAPSSSPTPSPTTVVVVSTTTAPASTSTPVAPAISSAASSSVPSTIGVPATSTMLTSMFSTTKQPAVATVTIWTSFPESSSQPRKGVNTDGDGDYSIPPAEATTVTSFVLPQSELEASPTPFPLPAPQNQTHHNKDKDMPDHGELSPLAEHLLIAAGAIGAFIMVAAGIFFFTRMKKIDLFASLRDRRIGRGGSRGFYGFRKQDEDYRSEPPPKYSGYSADEKSLDNTFYPPPKLSMRLMSPPPPASLAPESPQRQVQGLPAADLMSNAAPFELSPSPVTEPRTLSATQNFYNIGAQPATLSRQPSDPYSTAGTQSSIRPGYSNTGTQNTFLARQTSDAYDPNQRGVNHLSYLSSLSSGFGDGLIMPDPTVVGRHQSYRQSQAKPNTFSWAPSAVPGMPGNPGDRDTVYTTASIETAPRFRTVNSWVAQQAGRVERNMSVDREIPSMPQMPPMPPMPASIPNDGDAAHSRKPSEDPAYMRHPGQEVEIGRGTRIPSSILDRKITGG